MLLSLHVKNLALINESEVYFGDGLNILTGETGAGKSIIIDSINFALGSKINRELMRENSDYALVELIFLVKNKNLQSKINQLGIETEEDQIIFSRKLINGRSISKINGETVSATILKKISGILIDIHGQHEHQSLLNKKKHLEILDEYGREQIVSAKEKVSTLYDQYHEYYTELKNMKSDEESRKREVSFLQYQINEIDIANLELGEDEELEKKFKRLSNGKKILEAVSVSYEKTGYDNMGAGELIGNAAKELLSIADYDEKIKNLSDILLETDSLLNDFNRELSDYISENEFSEEDFYNIDNRLNLINNLKNKYGNSIEKILSKRDENEKQLDKLINYELYVTQLEEKIENIKSQLEKESEKLSKIRKKYSKELTKKVKDVLKELNFLQVDFDMIFEKMDNYTANGFDDAEFVISTNPGQKPRPLSKVASGGELSRIMLAIKTVLADSDDIDTLIFDEIDAGISGRTAQMVSEKMALIGKKHQVICITHLPQIAAMADSHYLIEKSILNDGTVSCINRLNEDESTQELCRILGGVKITKAVISTAREMKEMAKNIKKSLR